MKACFSEKTHATDSTKTVIETVKAGGSLDFTAVGGFRFATWSYVVKQLCVGVVHPEPLHASLAWLAKRNEQGDIH